MNQCKYCGHDKYYTKDYVYGSTLYFYRFDGEEADNSDYYTRLTHKQGEYAYCAKCNKRLFRI